MAERVWVVAMMRDEADVAVPWLHHHLGEAVDGIIVADNLSTDGTGDLLRDEARGAPVPVHVVEDLEPGYYQSRKMTALAAKAAELGATWIVPVDADELWVARTHHLGHVLRDLSPEVSVASCELLNHYCTGLDDLADVNPFTRLRWRHEQQNPMPKVAFRWRPDVVVGQGNHSVSWPGPQVVLTGELVAHHFAVRSAAHLVGKTRNGAAAYRATDLPGDQGAHWRGWGDILDSRGPEGIEELFEAHYFYPDPAAQGMVEEPAPWCRWSR